MDKQIVHKLALERCRVHVSHLCALTHLSSEFAHDEGVIQYWFIGVFESLNRDLALMESISVE